MNTEIIQTPSTTPSTADRLAALRQRATTPIEVWQPVAGDSLIGELIGSRHASGAYGENYQIIIKDENGNLTAAWLTQWLKDNLKSQGAGKGDLIALTFLGKKASPSQRFYNAYSLIVDKGEV